MLPLTSSVYVNGTLASKDSVLVDIGTGYYLEVCHACLQDPGALSIWSVVLYRMVTCLGPAVLMIKALRHVLNTALCDMNGSVRAAEVCR